MKILLTFIGNNDCYTNEGKYGAILSILEKEKYDKVYLLYSTESYLKAASDILVYCEKKYSNTTISYTPALVHNPTDYNTVYPEMYRVIKQIKAENPVAEYTISITSGTPTMHACWIFLREGGVIDARLIQVSREGIIDEICLELDDFPKINDVDNIKVVLTKVSRENKKLKEELHVYKDNIVGNSDIIKELKKQIQKIAPTDLSILITGKSGTGKELFAEAIHTNSKRKDKPFIRINCGAISPNLFESEFFGHKKGAFTSANEDKKGKFYEANGGTIFLDEIGDLPLDMQVKLLRVLENGTFTPVGDNNEIKVNVRIISATNKDLEELIDEKLFREDLFYRIAKDQITLPILKSRGNDLLLIADFFISNLNKSCNQTKTLDLDAKEALMGHDWAGNIRELKNVIDRAYAYSDDIITSVDLKLTKRKRNYIEIFIPDQGIDLDNEIIPQYYIEALKKSNGIKKHAAELLRIEEKTFLHRLKSKNINSAK